MKASVRDIKLSLDANGSYFFSRETMRFFGDSMRSFDTILDGDVTIMYRKPGASINVLGDTKQVTFDLGFGCWTWVDSDLRSIYNDEEKKRIWDKIMRTNIRT